MQHDTGATGAASSRPCFSFIVLFPIVCAFLLFPPSVLAYTEIIDFFIDPGIASLGRGGLESLPHSQETLDFRSPLLLDTHGRFRSDTQYEYQHTLRIYNGRWAGSHAYSGKLDTSVGAPFTLFDGKVTGSFAAGYDNRSFNIRATEKDSFDLRSNESLDSFKGGMQLKLANRFNLGISILSTDYRKSAEIPIQAEFAPLDYIRIGYKHSYVDMAADLSLRMSGHNGIIPLRYNEENHEVYLVGDYKGIFYAKYTNELFKPDDHAFEGRVNLPWTLYLVGSLGHQTLNYTENLYVEQKNAGYAKGDMVCDHYRAGIGGKIGQRWNLEFNYQHKELGLKGGGLVKSSAVIDFWPSLLVGNYNHIESAAISSDQYHVGVEYTGDRFSMATGVQYIDIKPAAGLQYWRSILFGMGKAGEESLNLETDRVQLLFLTFGLGYQWKNIAIKYAMGQFIPIGAHSTDSSKSSGGGSSHGGGSSNDGGSDIFSKIADTITHPPGGNIQRILLTITF